MNLHRSAPRTLSTLLSTMVIVAGAWVAGCGPSGAGSSPSSKKEVAEFLSKQSEVKQIKGRVPGGKNYQGPQSIKKKLFTSKAEETP